MKKDLPERLLRRWAGWSPAGQIAAFWLAVAGGAGIWALLLWLLAGRPVTVPAQWQAIYVAGLYVWLLGLCRAGRRALDLPKWPMWRPLALFPALAAGLGCVLLLYGLSLGAGWARLQPLQSQLSGWPQLAVQVAAMALAIATIEELVFRGLMLDLVRRRHGDAPALGAQAVIYALLHLLRTDLDLLAWLTALIGLGLTGLLLGRLRLLSGSLAASIGLHAGWIGLTSFCQWSGLLSWQTESARWSGLGNPVYGFSGVILIGLIALASVLPGRKKAAAGRL